MRVQRRAQRNRNRWAGSRQLRGMAKRFDGSGNVGRNFVDDLGEPIGPALTGNLWKGSARPAPIVPRESEARFERRYHLYQR